MRNDFSGIIGGEKYAWTVEAITHYHELQNTVAKHVDKHSKHGLHILEIGCGPGLTTQAILSQNNSAHITAVDKEPQMIAEAHINLQAHQPRVHLVLEDIVSFLQKIPDETYDGIASAWTLHNLTRDKRRELMPALHRVLKPGGKFVNGDKHKQNSDEQHTKDYLWTLEQLRKVGEKYDCPEWIEEYLTHYAFDEQPHIVYKESEAISDLANVGFQKPRVTYRKRLEAVVVANK